MKNQTYHAFSPSACLFFSRLLVFRLFLQRKTLVRRNPSRWEEIKARNLN